MRRLSLLVVLLPAFALLPSCGPAEEADGADVVDESAGEAVTEDPDDFGVGGKADSPTKALRFTLLQAGFFEQLPSRGYATDTALALRFGYAARPGAAAQSETEVPVNYTSGKNRSIVIVIPANRRTQHVAWKLKMKDWNGQIWWTEPHYASGRDPRGKFAAFPVENFAGYPFTNGCYSIRVRNPDGTWGPQYAGKVNNLFYGFTKSTVADYNRDNDVPWLDDAGSPGVAGNLNARITHNGGYKGTMILGRMFARVPTGRNVAFKLHIVKYDGPCGVSSEYQGSADTQTYLLPVR